MMGNEEGQGQILSSIPLLIVPNSPTAPQGFASWHQGKLDRQTAGPDAGTVSVRWAPGAESWEPGRGALRSNFNPLP